MTKVEFNPDGSIKLPGKVKNKVNVESIFRNHPAISVRRRQISTYNPLRCELIIKASDKVTNPSRIESLFNSARGKFKHMSQLSIRERNPHEYVVKIVSGSFRCSWCEKFRLYLGKEMNVKLIQEGTCLSYMKAGR
jgi:hypothetical protein